MSAWICGTLLAAVPANYYSSCENKSGKTLLTALYQTITNHTAVSYDGLWDLYKTTDVDENGLIWDMYSTKRWTPDKNKCGNYSLVGDCYNREHSLPKSWFNEKAPMKSDAFHIFPTDGKVNGQRSNFPYGECANGTRLASNGTVKALGRLGASTFAGYSGTVFEPDDEYKGDFARAYFYMVTAYNNQVASWDSEMLAGNAYPAFTTWAVNLLLKWHRQDPVSKKEIDRNEAVYARQKNRNPYIDHPELVEFVWGTRTSEAWSSTLGAAPEINTPVDGSTLDMGITAVGVSLTSTVNVRTTNCSTPITLSVSPSNFSVTPTSIAATTANSQNGATATVTFKATSVGTYAGVLTITCGNLSKKVNLEADVVDGLPLGKIENVTDESFDVCWTYVGDADSNGCYSLSVSDSDGLLSGYPMNVKASTGLYTVTNLAPLTTYTISMSSKTLRSETRTVTTAAPLPDVNFYFEGDLHLVTEPGEPSPAAEIWIETDNVDEDYTVSIQKPFRLSFDKIEWSNILTLTPEDDRIFVQILSDDEGEFESALVAQVGQYRIDDAVVTATVVSPEADFLETFENLPSGMGSYSSHEYQGTACSWHMEDIGIWASDSPHTGDYAIRGGKNGKAVLAMTEDRTKGIGTLRFWAHVWISDAVPEFDVMLSTNSGSTWTKVGTIKLAGSSYAEYSLAVNASGKSRIKLVQTAGKRFMLDDLSLSSHTSGLTDPEAEHNSWDAVSPESGTLLVRSTRPINISVYSLSGMTLVNAQEVTPDAPLTLSGLAPREVYIVATESFSRPVFVR